MTMNRKVSLGQIFLIPALLAAAIVFGLLSTLLGNGVWDVASWVALAVPLVISVYCIMRSTADHRT